jgi:dihydrofolate reductase
MENGMTLTAYVAMSLDGYIADEQNAVDWLNDIPNPDDSDFGFEAFMSTMDAVVMGAHTFKTVQSFGVWPYQKPVIVLSHSMKSVPEGYEEKIQIQKGDLKKLLKNLDDIGYENIYIDGGRVIQECLERGLLSKLVITHIPVILGGGVPLFRGGHARIRVHHKTTEVLGVGLVKSTYDIEAAQH